MDPLNVLAPNYMGDSFKNLGVTELVQNRGLGVNEVMPTNQQAMAQRELSTPAVMKDKLRVAKAREFGKSKETVGF